MDFSQLMTGVRESFSELTGWLIAQQPRLLSAAALLVAGWALALLLRMLSVRVIRALERIVPRGALRGGLPRLTLERQISDIIGLIVFWAVLLFFIAAAADALGLPALGASVAGLGYYVPRLLGAVLVLVLGLVVGNLARDAVTATAAAAGATLAVAIGQIVRVAILVAAALIAVAELGIDITLLTAILSVTVAAVLGAFALAFGLGARTAVSNIIGAHYLRQTFETGHTVRFGAIEGTIAAITATTVVIRVSDGQVVVPAKQFSERVTMLVTGGDAR